MQMCAYAHKVSVCICMLWSMTHSIERNTAFFFLGQHESNWIPVLPCWWESQSPLLLSISSPSWISQVSRVLIFVEIPGITSNYLVIHPHWFTAEIPFYAIFLSGLLTPIFFLPPLELKSLETSKWICRLLHLSAVFLAEVLSQSKLGVLAVHSTLRLPSPKSWGISLPGHPQRHFFLFSPLLISKDRVGLCCLPAAFAGCLTGIWGLDICLNVVKK